jgi:hypothetical protein
VLPYSFDAVKVYVVEDAGYTSTLGPPVTSPTPGDTERSIGPGPDTDHDNELDEPSSILAGDAVNALTDGAAPPETSCHSTSNEPAVSQFGTPTWNQYRDPACTPPVPISIALREQSTLPDSRASRLPPSNTPTNPLDKRLTDNWPVVGAVQEYQTE